MTAIVHRKADLQGPDFYPTPFWATKALLAHEKFEGTVLEPCCGAGHMTTVLIKAGLSVVASDLHKYGYAKPWVDALSLTKPVGNVITNPPYNLAERMIPVFLRIARRKVALLLRFSFLEGQKRYEKLLSKTPPARVYIFTERLRFDAAVINKKGSSSTICYCWLVWDKQRVGEETILRWIPPGFKPKKGKRGGIFRNGED